MFVQTCQFILTWDCLTQTLEDFYKIFGPEMKEVTGEHKHIDDMLQKVGSLVMPIEELGFNPFSMCKKESWKKVIQDFQSKVKVRLLIHFYGKGFVCFVSDFTLYPVSTFQAIEGEAINIINQSFQTLRSASVAFEMLLQFKHIRSREALNNQMMMKFNDIVTQYCKEVREHLKHLPIKGNNEEICGRGL